MDTSPKTSTIRGIVENTVNPTTNKTLKEEKRVLMVDAGHDILKIRYDRVSLSATDKATIEKNLKKELAPYYKPDKIIVIFISRSASSPPSRPPSPPPPSPGKKKAIEGVKNTIAVSSAKGGVGKSTVATNLALSLSAMGRSVGIVDADIYGPSLPMLLGKRKAKPVGTADKKIRPVEAHGISFISFGFFVDEKTPVIWRGPMLGGVLNQFLFDVTWGDLDYLVVDLPPGTGDMQLSLAQMANITGIITVSTPQDVALLDSKKGLSMFQKVHIPCLGMIENMSYFVPPDSSKKYFIFGHGGVEKTAKELGVEFLGQIPLDIELRESCDRGHPYMANRDYEGRSIWKSYMKIAKKIDKMVMGHDGKKGFFKKLF